MNDVFVWIETEKSVGYELLNAAKPIAKEMGKGLVAVVIGQDIECATRDSLCYGADSVIQIQGEEYQSYSTDAYAKAITFLIDKYKPEVFLIGATHNGRDLAPRVSCRVGTGLTADCTGIRYDEKEDVIVWTRPTFGGNLIADIVCADRRPQMGTVRPGVFSKGDYIFDKKGIIIEEEFHVLEEEIRTTIIERVSRVGEEVNLSEAKIVVAGGFGVGSKEGFVYLEELAKEIGGELACSRAVVEAGWLPYERQVGQSGKTITPDIYIAVGISGAIQHVMGMSGAKVIIAINQDPEAFIFKVSDYGIVGDYKQILPDLIRNLKQKNPPIQ